jgi:cytochrome c peroxidase
VKTIPIALILVALVMGMAVTTNAQGGPGGPGGPPPGLPPVPVPTGNAITPAKAVLGKILFWDEQLSSDNRMACGTCHRGGAGGGDPRVGVNPGADLAFGTPDDVFASPSVRRADSNNSFMPDPEFNLFPQVTGRTAPTMVNAAYAPQMFWDGRAGTVFNQPVSGINILPAGGALENQAAGPPLSGSEMAHDNRDWAEITAKLASVTPLQLASNIPSDMAAALNNDSSYPALFQAAFGTSQITSARIAMAIATYERILISDQTPFDAFIGGNPNALTAAQQAGLQTFNNNGRCNVCHTGPLTTDQTFRNIGVRPPIEDVGRQAVTNNLQDLGRFKVPTLRNVGLRARFMHNGQFTNLNQVANFYARGGDFAQNIDPVMGQINLPPNERNNLVDFLMNGLTDPRVAAEQFPFDRPTLNSEVNPNGSMILGADLPGSGNIAPIMMAFDPTNIGNVDYRLGVTTTLGATTAYLIYSDALAAPGTTYFGTPFTPDPLHPSFDFITVPTFGAGVGDGYATLHFPIPNLPALIGFTRYVQWLVIDPGSTSTLGVSASRGAKLVIL